MSDIQVSNDTTAHKFVITVDGTHAGESHYRDRDGERMFFHTEIGKEFGGMGLAGTLTEAALDETDGAIVAICPYVRGWLEKNEHDHTWRLPKPADIVWLQKELS